jgi:CIC family chloride channel protein
MAAFVRPIIATTREGWRTLVKKGPGQIRFWFIALPIGAGFAALFFRLGISLLQTTLYGTDDVRRIHSFAETLACYWILIIPLGGGLVVGLILDRFTGDGARRSRMAGSRRRKGWPRPQPRSSRCPRAVPRDGRGRSSTSPA